MKDFKSFLIGFLMCACMFLIMGHTKSMIPSPKKIGSHDHTSEDVYQLLQEVQTCACFH